MLVKEVEISPNDSDQNFRLLDVPLNTILKVTGASVSFEVDINPAVFPDGHLILGYVVKGFAPPNELALIPIRWFGLGEDGDPMLSWPVVLTGMKMGPCVDIVPEGAMLWVHTATNDQLVDPLDCTITVGFKEISIGDL